MTNLHPDRQNNLVSFLRHNQPVPPEASPQLEQQLFASLEPHPKPRRLRFKIAWIPGAIATGFVFTSISFGFRTPRIALEPKDLEKFLVKNWHNTVGHNSYTTTENMAADWLLPNSSESQQPTLAIYAQ